MAWYKIWVDIWKQRTWYLVWYLDQALVYQVENNDALIHGVVTHKLSSNHLGYESICSFPFSLQCQRNSSWNYQVGDDGNNSSIEVMSGDMN